MVLQKSGLSIHKQGLSDEFMKNFESDYSDLFYLNSSWGLKLCIGFTAGAQMVLKICFSLATPGNLHKAFGGDNEVRPLVSGETLLEEELVPAFEHAATG
ncbi:hypothetical protein H6P81_006575 [Aristolochia fimbriata]|uniref:Uncharacterized protein n=1 Tax=Aristolochia fimbriata TaxID=158543 RepID=A0AAV7F0G1_ARIFI|nr:hypothetical protein H6P81_006575 [Aristolochia fimbriata]